MKIFLLLFLMIIGIFIIGKKLIHSAKRNLFKDQAAWSGKDIKIKYTNPKEVTISKQNDNYLKMIANESKIYLEDQTKTEE